MAPTPKYGCHDTIRMRLIYQMYTYLTGAQPVVADTLLLAVGRDAKWARPRIWLTLRLSVRTHCC